MYACLEKLKVAPFDYIKTKKQKKKNVTISLAAFDEMVTLIKETIRISIMVGNLLKCYLSVDKNEKKVFIIYRLRDALS